MELNKELVVCKHDILTVKRASLIVAIIFFSLTLALVYSERTATIHPAIPVEDFSSDTAYPVLRTIDGDTVEIQYSGKPTAVRLIGVDTPETVHPKMPRATEMMDN